MSDKYKTMCKITFSSDEMAILRRALQAYRKIGAHPESVKALILEMEKRCDDAIPFVTSKPVGVL